MSDKNMRLLLNDEQRIHKKLIEAINLFEARKKAILEKRNPKSLTFVTMLDKPSRRKVDIKADYIGKEIEDLFVIGFGLDLDEKYRNLKDVCVYEN